jgi:threonine dehydrogenase-like Zn-dependent dehydrogenase
VAQRAHAAILTQPRKFEFRDFPIPATTESDAVLRVEAAGLCGTDYEQFGGHLQGTPWDVRPIIPGHEIQGWIENIGAEASKRWRVKEGDRVVVEASIPCGKCFQCQNGRAVLCSANMGYGLRISSDRPPHLWGGYATHMYLHPQANVHRAPDSLRCDVLSLCNPMSNAVRWGYERGRIGMGDSVLISGPGQRGLLAVVVAQAAGAALIIVTGTARDRGRLKMAKLLGAHATIVVDDEDPIARAKDLTGGHGVDVVLDVSAGALDPIIQAIEIVRPGGRIILAGLKNRKRLEGLVPDKLVLKEITLEGALASSWTSFEQSIALLRRYERELIKLCTHSYSIDEVETALRVLGREIVDQHEAVHVHIGGTSGVRDEARS